MILVDDGATGASMLAAVRTIRCWTGVRSVASRSRSVATSLPQALAAEAGVVCATMPAAFEAVGRSITTHQVTDDEVRELAR